MGGMVGEGKKTEDHGFFFGAVESTSYCNFTKVMESVIHVSFVDLYGLRQLTLVNGL